MAANNDPIYSKQGDPSNNNSTGMNQAVLTAANDFTGVSANNSLIFTAGTNGAYVRSIKLKAAGTNIASVVRFFLNNGATNTTATNNTFFGEVALPATTSTPTGITSSEFEFPVNMALPAGFKIYMGLGTTVASGWVATPIAGQY